MHITIRILLAILLIIDACFIADFNFTHPDNPYDYEKQPEKYDKAKKHQKTIAVIRVIVFIASIGSALSLFWDFGQ